MVEAGVLAEDEPLELLDGELVVVSPQGPTHAALLARLMERLVAAAGPDAHVRGQSPLAAGLHSLPEPDLCLVRGSSDDYLARHPAGSEALLAVEIAVTALPEARRKIPIYARAGVPQLWIVDVTARRLEVFTAPEGDRYRERGVLEPEEEVALGEGPVRLPVSELLP